MDDDRTFSAKSFAPRSLCTVWPGSQSRRCSLDVEQPTRSSWDTNHGSSTLRFQL